MGIGYTCPDWTPKKFDQEVVLRSLLVNTVPSEYVFSLWSILGLTTFISEQFSRNIVIF